MKNYVYASLLTGGICLGLATTASAAHLIYMQILGVTGDVQDKAYPGDIRLTSYSQAFTNPYTVGGNSAGSSDKTTCGAITFQKSLDSTSEFFLVNAMKGTHIRNASINFVHAAGTAGETAPYIIKLTNVYVVSIGQGDNAATASSALGVQETITVVADTFQFFYSTTNADGSPGNPMVFGWDCTRNSQL
jgi:type VI protein secretion system component Hcp